MPFVYRLETRHGQGVYSGTTVVRAQSKFHVDLYYDVERHPSPNNDARLSDVWRKLTMLGKDQSYYFGFSSKAQMRRWFFRADIRRFLAEQGIVMNKYEVSKQAFHRGMNQAIFRKDQARLVETFTQF